MNGKIFLIGSVLCLVSISACVKTLPEGALLFEAPPPPAANTQFVFETLDGSRWTETVSEDTSPFRGNAVYRTVTGRGRTNTWDAATHNLIAVHNSAGELMRYYDPHESEFEWPLWVGNSYWVSFRQVIVKPRRSGEETGSFQIQARVKVAAMEKITTPAGTFDTMRIEFNVRGWPPTTLWRAREIPVAVKISIEGRNKWERVLAEIR